MRKGKLTIILTFALLFALATAVSADKPAHWVEYVWEEDGQTYYYDAFDYLDTEELTFYTQEEWEEMMNPGSVQAVKPVEFKVKTEKNKTAGQIQAVPAKALVSETGDGIVAQGTCGENLTWVLDEEGTLTISGEGAMDDYGYNSAPWNEYRTSIKSLILSDGLTTIGNSAFYNCYSLTGDLIIPDSVISIGDNAFYKTRFKGSLTIPDGVISIGSYAFYNCTDFTGSLTIPDSLQEIGNSAFEACYNFTGSLTIPDSVTIISSSAFQDCRGFTGTLTIGSSVRTIGSKAFYGCTGFTGSLTIPDSVTWIDSRAFRFCSGFDGDLIIGESVSTIGVQAFEGCSGFKSIEFKGNSLQKIMSGAFNQCSGFEGKLEFPSSVTTIEYYAFTDCSGLEGELTFPNKVKEVGYRAFDGWTDLTTATFEGKAPEKFGEYNPYFTVLQGDNVFGEPAEVYDTFAIYYHEGKSGWTTPEWNGYRCYPLGTNPTPDEPTPDDPEKILRGDVNGDGVVDSNDSIYLLRYMMNPERYPINQPGDMNGDNAVDSNDAIYLLRHTLNRERYPLR